MCTRCAWLSYCCLSRNVGLLLVALFDFLVQLWLLRYFLFSEVYLSCSESVCLNSALSLWPPFCASVDGYHAFSLGTAEVKQGSQPGATLAFLLREGTYFHRALLPWVPGLKTFVQVSTEVTKARFFLFTKENIPHSLRPRQWFDVNSKPEHHIFNGLLE